MDARRHPAWLLAVGPLLGVLAALPARAQEGGWEWRGDLHPMWWPLVAVVAGIVVLFVLGWALVSLLPAILAIVGAVLGIRWLVRAGERPVDDRALAILRERYARGEITRDEFEARRRDLNA